MRGLAPRMIVQSARVERDQMKTITVTFNGRPGDAMDQKADEIAAKFQAKDVGRGTFLIGNPVRDIQYDVPNKHVKAATAELKAAGFDVDVEE